MNHVVIEIPYFNSMLCIHVMHLFMYFYFVFFQLNNYLQIKIYRFYYVFSLNYTLFYVFQVSKLMESTVVCYKC